MTEIIAWMTTPANAMSWVLLGFTVTNIELVGRRYRAGFLVGIAAQVPWAIFDVMTGAWGLIPLGFILSWRYLVAYRRWGQL